MFYQQILTGSAPYVASIIPMGDTVLHLHHEIELLYCISGSFGVVINGSKSLVKEGELAFIGSMSTHETAYKEDAEVLLIEIGPMFLKDHFNNICKGAEKGAVFSLNEERFSEIRRYFTRTVFECKNKTEFSDLKIMGNLYNICALLPEIFNAKNISKEKSRISESIGKALELIYYHYKENVTVDDAAAVTGYSKSNFCKAFKNALGMSFHAYLNDFRIENAKYLLNQTSASVNEIAAMTGFADSKNFCRAFKRETEQAPLEYRNGIKQRTDSTVISDY